MIATILKDLPTFIFRPSAPQSHTHMSGGPFRQEEKRGLVQNVSRAGTHQDRRSLGFSQSIRVDQGSGASMVDWGKFVSPPSPSPSGTVSCSQLPSALLNAVSLSLTLSLSLSHTHTTQQQQHSSLLRSPGSFLSYSSITDFIFTGRNVPFL